MMNQIERILNEHGFWFDKTQVKDEFYGGGFIYQWVLRFRNISDGLFYEFPDFTKLSGMNDNDKKWICFRVASDVNKNKNLIEFLGKGLVEKIKELEYGN